ncbi:MAG: hypothetical protein DHS20C09_22210 [marine bacterium B5-7]|nr:MAG: hypothetical protein DHS20C09_22210 [marine bacterium B5-7]
MPPDLSQSINPLRLAKARERIAGKIKLASLARLKGILLDDKGVLNYSLAFDFDDAGVCVIESSIDTQLILECQRCFKPVEIDIRKNSLLGVVDEGDESDALAMEYEPLELNEDSETTIEALIEDELLLSIPLSTLHPVDKCAGTNDLERINAEAKPQPFAGLAALIKNKD